MKHTLFALSLAASTLTAGQMQDMNATDSCSSCGQACDCCLCSCGEPPLKPCVDCECYTPQYYNLQCSWGVFVSVDFLYWYGKDTGLYLAHETEKVLSDISGAVSLFQYYPSKTETIRSSWDPGVRVGIGLDTCSDGWDVFLSWTYYKTTRSKSASTDSSVFLNPWMNPINGLPQLLPEGSGFFFIGSYPIVNSIRGSFYEQLQYIDLEIGRKGWLSRCLTLRPYVGLRGAWDKERFSIYSNYDLIELQQYQNTTKLKRKTWGVGFLAGIQPDWHFGCGFSLYGNLDLALLWGNYETHRNETSVTVNQVETLDFSIPRYKWDSDVMQPILDLGIGLRWERSFCCNRFLFSMDAGWEHHVWFDRSGFPQFNNGSTSLLSFTNSPNEISNISTEIDFTNGNIAFGGLVVRVRFDF